MFKFETFLRRNGFFFPSKTRRWEAKVLTVYKRLNNVNFSVNKILHSVNKDTYVLDNITCILLYIKVNK